jgi:hypothetical protein
MSINKNGFFEDLQSKGQYYYDTNLANYLTEFFKNENGTVADFGCGSGDYVKKFKNCGIDATGFDGNPKTPELTNGLCSVLDLSQPINLSPFDWVLSLEVGEHLPKEFEKTFINNLSNNNKRGIILSWAVKGQGGHGHFNEQDNDYIKSKFCELNYTNDLYLENELRKHSTLNWFKNTLMVFRKL